MAEATQSARMGWLRPKWAQSSHPVYRREMAGWSRSRPLRSLRLGAAPLAFVVFAATGCLCGLTLIDASTTPRERLLIWSIIILLSLWVGQWFVGFAAGLIATALTSTVISSEVESETYGLLRVTDIPTSEIVLAKYSAALRQLISPVAIVVVARLLLVAGSVATLDLALRMEGVDGGALGLLFALPSELVSPASVATFGAAILGWLIYFSFLKPVLTVLLHAAVGLFASSITRTRVNAIITAVGLLMVLAVVRFIASQLIAVGGQFSLGYFASLGALAPADLLDALIVNQPSAIVAVGGMAVLVSLLLTIGWRSFVTLLLVRGAVQRAYRLPFE